MVNRKSTRDLRYRVPINSAIFEKVRIFQVPWFIVRRFIAASRES